METIVFAIGGCILGYWLVEYFSAERRAARRFQRQWQNRIAREEARESCLRFKTNLPIMLTVLLGWMVLFNVVAMLWR